MYKKKGIGPSLHSKYLLEKFQHSESEGILSVINRSRRHSEKISRHTKKTNLMIMDISSKKENAKISNNDSLKFLQDCHLEDFQKHKIFNNSAQNSPLKIRSRFLNDAQIANGEEENQPTSSTETISIISSIIRVFIAFECIGLENGASVRLRILPLTTANEIVALVLEQITKVLLLFLLSGDF